MFRLLLILFILVPILELWGLITVGKMIGAPLTILLVLLSGILGAYMAKSQGLKVLREMEAALYRGELPMPYIMDGVMILIGGVLLLTPGFFTDLVGLFFLIPPSRMLIKRWLIDWLRERLAKGSITFTFFRRF